MFNHFYLQCRKRNININLNCKYTNYILDHTRVETAHMHNTSSHLALHGMWIHVRVQMQIQTLCATFATHRRTQRIHARSWKKTMQKETERHHHIAIHCHTHYIILPAALTLSPESSFEEFDYSLSRAPSDSVLWLLYCCITSRAARGGGGSFKNRKPIGKIRCCESQMSDQKHWLLVQLSNSLTD